MPERSRSLHDQVLASLEAFLEGVIRRGGDGNVTLAKPLPKKEQRALTGRLPPGTAAAFCEISAHIVVRWRLDEAGRADLPPALEDCQAAHVDLHPASFRQVDATWGSYADPYWGESAEGSRPYHDKAEALAELGQLDDAVNHLFWISPATRRGYADKHPAIQQRWQALMNIP